MELLNDGEGIDLSSDRLRPKEMLDGLGRPCRLAEKDDMLMTTIRLQRRRASDGSNVAVLTLI